MTKVQLAHAIRAACEVSQDNELWVFGSQAILAQRFDVPEALCTSIELDVQPKNKPDMTDVIDGNLGEGSQFNATFGFYVHGVSIESASLSEGWQSRTIPFYNKDTNNNTGWCLEIHDLAASKIAAFREKDKSFVRVLLIEELINPETLQQRISNLDIDKKVNETIGRWLEATVTELNED